MPACVAALPVAPYFRGNLNAGMKPSNSTRPVRYLSDRAAGPTLRLWPLVRAQASFICLKTGSSPILTAEHSSRCCRTGGRGFRGPNCIIRGVGLSRHPCGPLLISSKATLGQAIRPKKNPTPHNRVGLNPFSFQNRNDIAWCLIGQVFPDFFHLGKEAFAFRAGAFCTRNLVEFFQKFFLAVGQIDRRFDTDFNKHVPARL